MSPRRAVWVLRDVAGVVLTAWAVTLGVAFVGSHHPVFFAWAVLAAVTAAWLLGRRT